MKKSLWVGFFLLLPEFTLGEVQIFEPEDSIPAKEVFTLRLDSHALWWAIAENDGKTHAVKTDIRFSKPHCPVKGEACKASSHEVDLKLQPENKNARFLVRGLEQAPPDPIRTGRYETDICLITPGQTTAIVFGDAPAEIEARGPLNQLFEDKPMGFHLVLRARGNEQILWDVNRDGVYAWEEPCFKVSWAGDLDGDERMDLLMLLSEKSSNRPHKLYLSSKAAKGELVGLAATYINGHL